MLNIEYVEHNAHFSWWFQILNLSEAFDNTDIPLFETFLGVHNTVSFSFLPPFCTIFFSVSLTYSCSSSYSLNVTEFLLLFSSFFNKMILFLWSQQSSPCRWQMTPHFTSPSPFSTENKTFQLLWGRHGYQRSWRLHKYKFKSWFP